MSIQRYEIFDEIAKQKNFARAADVLGMSPSAVSHAVAALEAEIGFPLFFRSRTRVSLTKEGERMLVHAREILRAERAMKEEAAGILGLESGTVVIGTFSSVCLSWMPEIVSLFKSKYPKVTVRVMQGDYSDVMDWVKSGEVDMGFETLPTSEKLTEIPLKRDRLLCVGPPDLEPANGRSVTAEDMRSMPFILQRSGYEADTVKFLTSRGIKVRADLRVDDDRAIISFAARGLGIGLMPELALQGVAENVSIYPVEPEESRLIGLITQAKVDLSPAAEAMKEFITDYVSGIDADGGSDLAAMRGQRQNI